MIGQAVQNEIHAPEPWQQAAQVGNLKPAQNELTRRIRSAEQTVSVRGWELASMLRDQLLRPMSKEDAAGLEQEIREVEAEIAQARLTIERSRRALDQIT